MTAAPAGNQAGAAASSFTHVRFTPRPTQGWAALLPDEAGAEGDPATALGDPNLAREMAYPGSARYAAVTLGQPGRVRPMTGLLAGRLDGQPLSRAARPDLLTVGPQREDLPQGDGYLSTAGYLGDLHLLLACELLVGALPKGAALTLPAARARRLLVCLQLSEHWPGELPAALLRAELGEDHGARDALWAQLGMGADEAGDGPARPKGQGQLRLTDRTVQGVSRAVARAACAPGTRVEAEWKSGAEHAHCTARGELAAVRWARPASGERGIWLLYRSWWTEVQARIAGDDKLAVLIEIMRGQDLEAHARGSEERQQELAALLRACPDLHEERT